MKAYKFGTSELGLMIPGFQFGNSTKKVLLLAGVHGDEVEGVALAYQLVEEFSKDFNYDLELHIVPSFNMDGVLLSQRKNWNGVDLNRNLPSKDWTTEVSKESYYPGKSANSEIENQNLVKWIEQNKPTYIVSLHSFSRYLLNVNGDCGEFANVIHKITSYPIEESIGYPTPGCLGTYTGLEMGIPTLTYELHRGEKLDDLLPIHLKAIKEALKEI